jgi:hypothetical protein
MVAQFRMVIRAWRGGRCQLKPHPVECFLDCRPCAPRVAFQDAAFIQHNSAKRCRVQFRQPLIVRHHHARANFGLFAYLASVYAKLLPFPDHLTGNSKRRENKRRLARFLCALLGKFQFNQAFAQSCIEKASRFAPL